MKSERLKAVGEKSIGSRETLKSELAGYKYPQFLELPHRPNLKRIKRRGR
jgi:hypothetical protein